MINEILKGGVINVILVIAYFAVCLIVLERVLYYLYTAGSYVKFTKALFGLLNHDINEKEVLSSEKLIKYKRTPYYQFFVAYMECKSKSENIQKECLTQHGTDIIARYESLTWMLSLIGHLAPLMGLLGTMTGLIRSFRAIESYGGSVDVSILAGGIWEAMMTTVMGLIVAILAFFCHRIIDHYVDKKSLKLDRLLTELNSYFKNDVEIIVRECDRVTSGAEDEIS